MDTSTIKIICLTIKQIRHPCHHLKILNLNLKKKRQDKPVKMMIGLKGDNEMRT